MRFLKQLGDFLEILTRFFRRLEEEMLDKAIEKGGVNAEKELGSPTAGQPSRHSGHAGMRVDESKKTD